MIDLLKRIPTRRSIVLGRWMFAATTLAGALSASAAQAQSTEQTQSTDSSEVLEMIVVTAQRREQSLQSVPSAITAVTAETIEKSNIRGVEGILAQTPNVSFVTNGSRDRKDISIRGVSNQLDPYLDVRPAAFAIYIDDFNVTEGTSNPQIVDLERIEVLRGPQGTYFGRNATAGAINVTTKKPNDEFGWEGSLGYSSFDTRTATLIVNAPIVADRLAIRVAGQIEESEGNIKNINPLGGGNTTDYKTARVVARWTPTNTITNDLAYSFSQERNGMRAGVPTGFLTATWRNVYYRNAPGNIADPDSVGFFPTNTDQVNFNRPQSVGTDFYYISDRATFDFGPATLTAVAGYLSSEVFNKGDVDGSSRDYFYETAIYDHTSTSGELRLQSNGDDRLEWSIGINAGRDTGATWQSTRAGTGGILGRLPDTEGARVISTGSNRSLAGFGQATYKLTDELAASVGLRYTKDEVRGSLRRFNLGVQTDLTDRSKSYDDVSPRFNITYTPNPDLMLYATASKGYKAGGVQTLQLLTKQFYEPETLWNYEGGAKFSAFGGALRADVGAFYSNWRDVQQQTRFQIVTPSGVITPVTGIDNAARAISKGVDGSFDLRLRPGLSAGAHVGYVDGEFTEWPSALIDGAFVNATGRPLINAPKWTAGARVDYRRPLFGDYDGFVRPEWRYRSEKLSSILGIRYFQYPFISPGYSVFNLRAGIDNGDISVTVYAENLFNEGYYENVYEKAFYSGVHLEPSVRSYGVTVRVKHW